MRDSVIGLLSWDYGRPKGGMGRSMRHLAGVLRADGLTVKILAPCPGQSPDDPLLRFTGRFGGQILFSLLLPLVLGLRIKSQVLDRLLLPVGPGGVLLLSRPSVPATAIVYHTYAQQSLLVPGQRWKSIFCPFERRTLRFSDRILCFCADTKAALIRAYGIDAEKIIVVSHAVDIPMLSAEPRQYGLCVCVARLEARKGIDVLLKAWSLIVQRIPHAKLVIVGDGVMRGEIDRMIAGTTNVERRSSVTDEELKALRAQSQVAFCPAYLEGFGLACAEAMAAGSAVIASDTDGLRRLIHHDVNGVLVPPGNVPALAEAAIRILSDPEKSHRLAIAARLHIEDICNSEAADRAFALAVRDEES